MDQSLEDRIRAQIADHEVIVYMKGTPQFPQCGFSSQVVHILKLCQARFGYVNILEHPDIRATLPKIAHWPTFPQLYIQGALIGGCDISTELYEKGELLPLLAQAGALSEKSSSYNVFKDLDAS